MVPSKQPENRMSHWSTADRFKRNISMPYGDNLAEIGNSNLLPGIL
jgi:hypothetical protein